MFEHLDGPLVCESFPCDSGPLPLPNTGTQGGEVSPSLSWAFAMDPTKPKPPPRLASCQRFAFSQALIAAEKEMTLSKHLGSHAPARKQPIGTKIGLLTGNLRGKKKNMPGVSCWCSFSKTNQPHQTKKEAKPTKDARIRGTAAAP